MLQQKTCSVFGEFTGSNKNTGNWHSSREQAGLVFIFNAVTLTNVLCTQIMIAHFMQIQHDVLLRLYTVYWPTRDTQLSSPKFTLSLWWEHSKILSSSFYYLFSHNSCLFSKGLSASFEWVIKAKDIIVLSCIKILKSVPPLNVQSITNQNENTKKKIIKNYSFNKYWIQFQLLFIRVITYLTLVI